MLRFDKVYFCRFSSKTVVFVGFVVCEFRCVFVGEGGMDRFEGGYKLFVLIVIYFFSYVEEV